MTRPKELNPYLSPRAFYGAELRRLREGAKLSQDDLGAQVFVSGAYIGQFETAVRRPQLDISQMFDEIFGTGEHLQRLCKLANEAEPHPEYFAKVAELEEQADTISQFAPMLVPGLLQTEQYARALMRATLPFAPAAQIDKFVSGRLGRQKILQRSTPPLLWAVLHETALRIPASDADVMIGQLDHLLETARSHHRVELQVVPLSEGFFPLMNQNLKLMTFSDAPPVAYMETDHTGQLLDVPTLVDGFQKSYDYVKAVALSPKASLQLIESTVKDLRNS
ncbi:Scr1 family TA system antitoxin-like transcriptional regulator [Streptomyces sp. NPDC049879]|uniref:helix-turn-helix domain-containing protein n=1 Tax=Streptomyces sp. NPDC049879 TaxID=3365598 RepID=UPI0037AA4488